MLHNHQGKLYRLTMLVVLFILMVSMAPAQPALAGGVPAPLQAADSYEPDNSSGQAKRIGAGETTHSIDPVGDVDWVSFAVYGGDMGMIIRTSTSGDAVITLYYAGSQGLAQISANGRTCAEKNPLPEGIYYLKVEERGNDALVASYTLSLSLTPCWNILVNPGFESSTRMEGWQAYRTEGPDPYCTVPEFCPIPDTGSDYLLTQLERHSGSFSAELFPCIYEYQCTSVVQQEFTVPPNGQLTYWWMFSFAYTDIEPMSVSLLTPSGSEITMLRTWTFQSIIERYWDGANPIGHVWWPDTIDLSAYAGQTVVLRFQGYATSQSNTVWYIDDVAVRQRP